jgi:hypothetical protein
MSLAKSAVAACAIAVMAAAAQAGTISGASGPILVNRNEVTIAPGKPLTLKADDVVDARQARVTYRSDKGDDITFEAGSVFREYPTTDVAAGVFLLRGSASGVLSDKTQFGVAAGWVTAPAGQRTRILVEPTPGKEAVESLFRATEGVADVRYESFQVRLMPAHSVTLSIEPKMIGNLCFRTGQQNAGDVEIIRKVRGGDIVATVPKATLGCFTDEAGDKTKICDDLNSLKSAKIHLESRFAKSQSKGSADIGPGTCALIDNSTGAIEVLFSAVKFEILERAISLTSEFSTLAQSNFSDVK